MHCTPEKEPGPVMTCFTLPFRLSHVYLVYPCSVVWPWGDTGLSSWVFTRSFTVEGLSEVRSLFYRVFRSRVGRSITPPTPPSRDGWVLLPRTVPLGTRFGSGARRVKVERPRDPLASKGKNECTSVSWRWMSLEFVSLFPDVLP